MRKVSISKILLNVFMLLLVVNGCKDKPEGVRVVLKSAGGFPEIPMNLSIFNSVFDDYNSDIEPGEYDTYNFVFSSNRNSQGANFDILLYSVNIIYPFAEDVVSIYESYGFTDSYHYIQQMQPMLNLSDSEYGPFIYTCNINDDSHEREFIFFYTQEEGDNLNIRFMINELEYSVNYTSSYLRTGPYDANTLNTDEFNEGYVSMDHDTLYFCGDVNGNFDIFQKTIPTDTDLIEFLSQAPDSVNTPVSGINSNFDEKCPYVVDDLMVFVSNRPGGFGGYDLYYCKMINGNWSEPVNFGSSINTEFDEFRPIFRAYEYIPNDLLIFSSNRPGGFGGFDLYYAGIDVMR